MAAETGMISLSELELFRRFVDTCLSNGGKQMSLDECLADFREYQSELARLREEIRPALERSLRGESKPFDIEALRAEVERRMDDLGIPE